MNAIIPDSYYSKLITHLITGVNIATA